MYPLQKGKTAKQAHVGLPNGTFEEEHGRKGFYGKSAHLYHLHPPTGWTRFEGKLRPHCIDCNKLQPTDEKDAKGSPVAFLGNNDVTLYVSRRSKTMPYYYRNADGDELHFIHRGEGTMQTEFEQPEKGLLGQHGLYDPAVVTTPKPAPSTEKKKEWEVRIKVDDEFSSVFYPFHPLDVVGWKGDLTVWKINMRDIRPIIDRKS